MRHEELKKQYEQDVKNHGGRAYTLWEFARKPGAEYRQCRDHPEWKEWRQYRRKPAGHPHAALMAQYAEDAATHERPWELWEGYFAKSINPTWYPMGTNPSWFRDYEYRRKPEPVEQTQPYTITCTMVINAADSSEAAWTFRKLVASGCQPVQWVDDCGVTQDKCGLRPKGDNEQTAHELLTKAYDRMEELQANSPLNVDDVQALLNQARQLLREPEPAAKLHTITLTSDQLREVVLACEYPDWENEDFISAENILRRALGVPNETQR